MPINNDGEDAGGEGCVSVPTAGGEPCECEVGGDWRGCWRRRLVVKLFVEQAENPVNVRQVERMLEKKVDNNMSLFTGRIENPVKVWRVEKMLEGKIDNNIFLPQGRWRTL